MFTCRMIRYVSCEWSEAGEGWLTVTSQDYRMLAKISKSFKGSLGNLISDPDESYNHLGSIGEYSGSVVSESTDFNMRSVSMVRLSL